MATSTRHAIAQLRRNLEDAEDPAQLIQNDLYLALWLNLKHSDVRKAEVAIRDALAWWKAKDIPSLVQEAFPPALSNKLPIILDGISKEGLPVGYVRIASLDFHGLFSEFKDADAVRFCIQMAVNGQSTVLEINRLQYEKLGDEALKSAQGFIAIIDAYGVSRRNMPPLKAINLFVQAARDFLKVPSTARVAYIIGVNTFFLAMTKPLIPFFSSLGVTLKVYGTDEKTWQLELSQLIDMRTLQEFRERASKFEKAHQNDRRYDKK